MIKVVIFDIGDVIIDNKRSFDVIYEEFAREVGAPPDQMVRLYHDHLDRLLYGKISGSAFFALIKKRFKTKRDLKKAWVAIATKHMAPNKALLKMVDKLRLRYQVAILSNLSQMRGFIDEEFGLYEHFDRVFLSYKLKMKKPSKRIFLYTLKSLKVRPNEILFIDDKEANLRVARELGIQCIQFNNNAQLKNELAPLGLL